MRLATEICDRASALEFLLGRINYERTTLPYRSAEFKLERMHRLLSLLGDPHLALRAVHIAGTKGKGSTAAMIASVLSSAGYVTGLYTSPHLERLEERFLIQGVPCSEQEFVALAARVQLAVGEMERAAGVSGSMLDCPTFFEVTTAMAMLHFAQHGVDAAVLEVGLGGRLDSTNVCRPEVCVITSISYDHTRQLGNTLAEIATEKAGIIKPGIPVVSGVVQEEPRRAILDVSARLHVRLWERGRDFSAIPVPATALPEWRGQVLDYREGNGAEAWELNSVFLPLLGRHQAENAATGIAALRRLVERGWQIPDDAIRRGMAQARCAARIELVRRRPDVIVDVAHNVASVQAVVEVLRQEFPVGKKILIFASSRDKDVRGMLQALLAEFDHVVLTQFQTNPRAMSAAELHALACEVRTSGSRPTLMSLTDPLAGWQRARELAGADDLICITGSFFLAADLLAHVR